MLRIGNTFTGNAFPVNRGSRYLTASPNATHVNEDCFLHFAFAVKGYTALATTVNFVKIIGVTGVNFTEKMFKEIGLDRTVLDEIPEFSNVEKFILVT